MHEPNPTDRRSLTCSVKRIYNVETMEVAMRVEVCKWGNSAAVRVPAPALKDAGLEVGQSLELRVEEGRLVLEPATEDLDMLLSKVTPENRHRLELDDTAVGAEAW